ncbi:DUF2272 domain-containing protein [Roseomonas gilardii subsp. gilardii]|uniref:DUF2272 domain-containing protein n=1 Tax=Roseomonas gilardii TaxID=257708 RepID=UPI001FF99A03|nr:DUF2272 domain-containing protein [Roseomonas gilardii]UPG70896.1 DUF2272 domain-containing protein [Roseomonas gilardii subsp. gilardii]
MLLSSPSRSAGKRARGFLLALLPALLLAACATPPAATRALREPPLSYPPSAKERIIRFALTEWQDWGGTVTAPGERRPPSKAPGPESSLTNFPRVLAYWRAVEEDRPVIDRNRDLYAAALQGAATAPWREPAWSAAFISWVMRSAGVDVREFPGNAAHSFYLDAIIADARDFPAQAPFIPRSLGGYAPAPGDLVCADRSRRPLTDWRDRLGETGKFRAMHCDIVVRVAPFVVEAVGGNVEDTVTMTRFPTDAAGRLLPRPAGEPVLFGVIENRIGTLPPFGAVAPAAGSRDAPLS